MRLRNNGNTKRITIQQLSLEFCLYRVKRVNRGVLFLPVFLRLSGGESE